MTTVAAWGLVASMASAAYTGYTQHQTNKFNAEVANKEAKFQEQKGAVESEQAMKRMRIAMAGNKVSAATSGASLMSSSFQSVFEEQAEEGIFDALLIKSNADNAVSSALNQSSQFSSAAGASLVSAGLKSGSTILTNYRPSSSVSNSITYKGTSSQFGGSGQATVGF